MNQIGDWTGVGLLGTEKVEKTTCYPMTTMVMIMIIAMFFLNVGIKVDQFVFLIKGAKKGQLFSIGDLVQCTVTSILKNILL